MPHATDYSEEKALVICERHAAGETIKQICAAAGMPGRRTVYHWLKRHPEFAELLRYAREEFVMGLMKDMLSIADRVHDPGDVPVARLQIETRRSIAQMMILAATRQPNYQTRARLPDPPTITLDADPGEVE